MLGMRPKPFETFQKIHHFGMERLPRADTSVILKENCAEFGAECEYQILWREEETVWKYSAGDILKSNGVLASIHYSHLRISHGKLQQS